MFQVSLRAVHFPVVAFFIAILLVWNQKIRLQPNSYELSAPKSPPLFSNASGNPCNTTKVIIFWNKFWNKYIYNAFGIDKGPEVFKHCNNKNCVITKDRSKLYNPEYIVSAIVFFGVGIKKIENEFKKIQNFKKSKEWVILKNGGITPKILLFMRVMFFVCIGFIFEFCFL